MWYSAFSLRSPSATAFLISAGSSVVSSYSSALICSSRAFLMSSMRGSALLGLRRVPTGRWSENSIIRDSPFPLTPDTPVHGACGLICEQRGMELREECAGSSDVFGGVRVGKQSRLTAGEEAFKQQRRGDLVDEVFAVDRLAMAAACCAGAVSGGVQQGVGFERGQPLVEQMVCECGVLLTHGGGKGQGLCRLGAGRPVGVERIADDDD